MGNLQSIKKLYNIKIRVSIKTFTLTLLAVIFLMPSPQPFAVQAKDEKFFQEALDLYKNLQTNPNQITNYEIWDTIAQAFYSIYRTYPASPKAATSLFISGKMYEEMGIRFNSRENLEKSIMLSRELIKVFPGTDLADDAQIRIARITEGWDKSRAYLEYERVIRNFPNSDMVDAAKLKLKELAAYKPTEKQTPEEVTETKTQNNPNGLASISQIGHWSTDTYTRVVINVDRETIFEPHFLKAGLVEGAPTRLYVDIKGATVDRNLEMPPIENGLLEDIRFARNTLDTVRVVLYINSFKNYKVFSLHDPFRIVMDIYGNEKNNVASKPKGSEEDKTLAGLPKLDGKDISTLRGALGLKVRTVVIDPGHGGHDPGAIGPTGLKEKDVTLAIAKVLKNKMGEIGREFGISRIILTREDDRFIPLEERTGIAKREHADLFISIHCNAAKDSEAHGIETYILSFSNDPEALAVAARENVSTTKGISDLKDIIQKYLLNSKIDESKRLAVYIQTSVTTNLAGRYQTVISKGVKKAPFIVLIGADIPSILVETSFITNPREEKKLRDPQYINEIADGILRGIRLYSTEVETASVAR
jgi:N-acetylmuramoyl-L-alanine amidase